MIRGCVRALLGVGISVVLPSVQVLAQEGPIVYQVMADQNGNVVATQTLPDGTVVPVNLRQNGIVLDPGDVGREFTVGNTAAAPPKGAGGPPVDVRQVREQEAIRRANAMKQELGCTDEEWNVLGPKIQAIELLQTTLGERPLGPGGKGATVPVPSIMAAVTDLRARQGDFRRAIADRYLEPDIKSKMASVREARSRARQELVRTQKELTELVTIRQEAVLLERRILE